VQIFKIAELSPPPLGCGPLNPNTFFMLIWCVCGTTFPRLSLGCFLTTLPDQWLQCQANGSNVCRVLRLSSPSHTPHPVPLNPKTILKLTCILKLTWWLCGTAVPPLSTPSVARSTSSSPGLTNRFCQLGLTDRFHTKS